LYNAGQCHRRDVACNVSTERPPPSAITTNAANANSNANANAIVWTLRATFVQRRATSM
jgi:hypothetical protein